MTSITHDSISLRGAGVVTVAQPGKGFRFTQDSILLADFCRIKPGDRVLEPGAVNGSSLSRPYARWIAATLPPKSRLD